MTGYTRRSELTLAQFFEILSEPLLSLTVVLAPAIESPVLLPLSSPLGPARSRALDFVPEEGFEVFLRVRFVLLLLYLALPELACAVAAVFIKRLFTRRN